MKLCIFKCYLNASKASDPRWVTCNNSRQSSYLEIQTIQCLSPLGGRKLTLSVRNKVLDSIPHWGIEQRHRKTCYSPAVLLFSHWVIFHVVPWATAHQPSLSFTSFQSLLKLMSIELVMPSKHLILCHPLLLPIVFPSIRAFSNELALHTRWPQYWSFSFSISPSNEYSELVSLRIDWFQARILEWEAIPF